MQAADKPEPPSTTTLLPMGCTTNGTWYGTTTSGASPTRACTVFGGSGRAAVNRSTSHCCMHAPNVPVRVRVDGRRREPRARVARVLAQLLPVLLLPVPPVVSERAQKDGRRSAR
jgi:hypothetical protein